MKLVRQISHPGKYSSCFPILDIDITTTRQLIPILCDHLPCSNQNSEFEFAVGNYVLDGYLDKEELNLNRPLALHDLDGSTDTAPEYQDDLGNNCW